MPKWSQISLHPYPKLQSHTSTLERASSIPLLCAFYLRLVVRDVRLSAGSVCSAALSGITAPISTMDSSSKSNANEARPSSFPSVLASDRSSPSLLQMIHCRRELNPERGCSVLLCPVFFALCFFIFYELPLSFSLICSCSTPQRQEHKKSPNPIAFFPA